MTNMPINERENTWKKAVIASVLILLLLLLLIQHNVVGLYYDDFGNASLSYGYDSSSIPGTAYTLKDLIEWAKYTYNNWGGRILYALILIPLTKHNAVLFGIVQSIIITLLFLISYLFASQYKEKKSFSISGLVVAILTYFSLYGDINRYGIYWASASVLYVWPLLFFILAAYVYEKACVQEEESGKIRSSCYFLLLLLVPLVTLSQEQLGFAFAAWTCCQGLLKLIRKKINKLDIFLIVWSLITYALFLSAPGNWKRLADSGEFAQLSIFQKVIYNVPNILNLMLYEGLRYFNVLLAVSGLFMVLRSRRKKKLFKIISSVIIIAQIISILIPGVGTLDLIVFSCFIINMFLILLDYYHSHQRRRFIQLLISGVASVCFLIVSPSLQMRSFIPYVCFFTILIGDVFADYITETGMNTRTKKAFAIVAFTAMTVPAFYCAAVNYIGYKQNDYIQQYNDKIFRSYDGTQERLYLLSYGNRKYRAQMPSDSGYASIGSWMKEYYNIPQSVMLIWKPLDEYLELAEKQVIDYSIGPGCYDKEGTFFWTQNNASISIKNHSASSVEAAIDFSAFTGYEEISRITLAVNGEKIGEWPVNNAGQHIETAIVLLPGENTIQISTDARQVDSGADLRTLYLRIDGLNIEAK